MATRTLEVLVTADKSRFDRNMRGIDATTDRSQKRMHDFGKVGRAAFAGIGLAGAAAVAGLKKSAEAAIEAEKTQGRLEAQLRASGIAYDKHADQIENVISKVSQLSGLDDEDLTDSFTNIVRVTGDVNKSLRLTGLAADFARAKHMDVAKAGELVGKVAGGNTGILGRYGIKIKEGATATEALGELQKKFSGQAKAYGETTAGAADRSQVAFENLGETIGAHVTPIIARVAEGFTTLVRQMTLGEGPGGRIRSVLEGIGSSASFSISSLRDLYTGFQEGEGKARLLAGTLAGLATAFVAFKTVTTITAAVNGLQVAWVALGAAVAANPIGALALGVTAVIGALGIMSIRSREASTSSRDFNDALREQANALREVRDIDIDVAQRKANVKSATVGVEAAEKRLRDLRKSGKATAIDLKQAEADLSQAKVSQRRANRDLARSEEDSQRKKEDAKQATAKLTDEEQKLNRNINKNIATRADEIRGIDDSIDAVKHQGVQNDATRKTVEKLRERQRDLRNEINELKSKKVDVSVKFKLEPAPGSSWGSSVGDGTGVDMKAGVDASVTKLAQNNVDSLMADGLGPIFPGGGGGNLFGALPFMGAVATLGSRFGLSVTSGRDNHSKFTSSGNVSNHFLGHALDISNGASPTPQMMAFAKFMIANFGSQLSELIYTPLGYSIKHGQRVAPIAASDHYDHVHVALDAPLRGVPARPRRPRTGDGTGVNLKGINFSPAQIKFAVAAAGASGLDPRVIAAWMNREFNGYRKTDTRGKYNFMSVGYTDSGDYGWLGNAVNDPTTAGRATGLWLTGNLKGAPQAAAGIQAIADTAGGSIRSQVQAIISSPWASGHYYNDVSGFSADARAISGFGKVDGGSPGAGGGGGGTAKNPARAKWEAAQKRVKGKAGDAVEAARNEALTGGGALELSIARAQTLQARATSKDDLAGLIKGLKQERDVKRRRLRRVRKLLKRKHRLGRKNRVALLNEEAQLLADIGDLNETIKEYKADQKGGATTVTRAEELDAGVDPNAPPPPDPPEGPTPEQIAAQEAQAARDAIAAELAELVRQQVANQQTIIRLTTQQGPQILAAVIAAVNGDIGGKVGLGYQTPGYAGATAKY